MKILVLTAAAFALAGAAVAQVPSTTTPSQAAKPADKTDKFASIDADASGALSLAEIKLVDVAVTQADFDKYDADKSKSISKVEFDKWQAGAKAKPAHDAG